MVVSYMDHQSGMKGTRTNWDKGTAVAALSNFRASKNSDRSQIATATLTLPRNKSTRKYNTLICITIHWLFAEKIEAWNGIVYVKVVHNVVELFFARNDTERNTVSVISCMCTVFDPHACTRTLSTSAYRGTHRGGSRTPKPKASSVRAIPQEGTRRSSC